MTHRLATGNKVMIYEDKALFLTKTALIVEVSPRKAVAMVVRDATLRGNPHFDHDFGKGVDR